MVRVIDGMKHRPRSTFGTVNAGVLQHFDDSFVRDDFVDIILNNGRINPTLARPSTGTRLLDTIGVSRSVDIWRRSHSGAA